MQRLLEIRKPLGLQNKIDLKHLHNHTPETAPEYGWNNLQTSTNKLLFSKSPHFHHNLWYSLPHKFCTENSLVVFLGFFN